MTGKKETVASVIISILISGYLTFIYFDYTKCVDTGGDYVRGVFWFTCLK